VKTVGEAVPEHFVLSAVARCAGFRWRPLRYHKRARLSGTRCVGEVSDELADEMGGSVDAVTGTAICAFGESRPRQVNLHRRT